MRKQKEVMIVLEDVKDITTKINRLTKEGFELIGTVSYYPETIINDEFMLATMIKYEDKVMTEDN